PVASVIGVVAPARSICMTLPAPSIQNTDVPSAARAEMGLWPVAMIWPAVGSQTPPVQIPPQGTPQPPQLATSRWGSTQAPLQSAIPGSQTWPHAPALQTASPPYGAAQAEQVGPQQVGSPAMSAHLPSTAA